MKLIPTAISQKIARQGLLASKNSPTILFGAGVVGMVGSTVLACRATLKMHEVLDTAQEDLGQARKLAHFQDERYTETDRKKDTAIIYARSAGKVGRLYAPSIILGAASIACLTKSHNILQERNLALAAAYTAVDEAFKAYRERVVEKYGEEEDRNLRYETEVVTGYDPETDKPIEETILAESNGKSMYARWFDDQSSNWSEEPYYNFAFLRSAQNWFNDMLRSRGHVFLNEVYDHLDIPRTRPGSVVGWIINDNGDNFVDFGIFEDEEKTRGFVNGREGSILLDFNVDGVIWDKIDEKERLRWKK